MGILDRLKPAPLLRSGPLLVLPSGTSPDAVDALVAAWAPMRRRKGDDWQLADGLRWVGPIEVSMTDVTEHDLPGGYPIAYVAQAKRSRGDGFSDRLMDRTLARSFAKAERQIDEALVATGETTQAQLDADRAEAAARTARDYPQGEPWDVECDAWRLVCGLARRLRGTCRLSDGRFFVPDILDQDDPILYARTQLDAAEVARLVEPLLGPLEEGVPDIELPRLLGVDVNDDVGEWTIARGRGQQRVSVRVDVWERDADARMPGMDEPLAVFDSVGGRPVEYQFVAPSALQPALREACGLLAPLVDGIVVDEEGFPVG